MVALSLTAILGLKYLNLIVPVIIISYGRLQFKFIPKKSVKFQSGPETVGKGFSSDVIGDGPFPNQPTVLAEFYNSVTAYHIIVRFLKDAYVYGRDDLLESLNQQLGFEYSSEPYYDMDDHVIVVARDLLVHGLGPFRYRANVIEVDGGQRVNLIHTVGGVDVDATIFGFSLMYEHLEDYPNIVSYVNHTQDSVVRIMDLGDMDRWAGRRYSNMYYFDHQFKVGMINNRVINNGAAHRGGNVFGPFPPGDPRRVDPVEALRVAAALGRAGNQANGLPAPAYNPGAIGRAPLAIPLPPLPQPLPNIPHIPLPPPIPLVPVPPAPPIVPPLPPVPPVPPVPRIRGFVPPNRHQNYDGFGNPNAHIPHDPDFHPEVPEWHLRWKEIENNFIHSDFPQNKCLFDQSDLNNYSEDSVLLDPIGDPFCGLTAIDLAVGVLPKVDVYLKRARSMASPYDVGTNVYLRKYAHYRGVNLRIIIPFSNDIPTRYLNYCNNPQWKWVIMVVKDCNGELLDVNPDQDHIYHAFLVIDEKSDHSNLVLSAVADQPFPYYLILENYVLSVCFSYFILFWMTIAPAMVMEIAYCLVFDVCDKYVSFTYRHINILEWFGGKYIYGIPWLYFEEVVYGQVWITWFCSYIVPWLDEVVFIWYFFHIVFQLSFEWRLVEYRYNNNNYDKRTVRDRRDVAEGQDHYGLMIYCPVLRVFNKVVWRIENLGYQRLRLISVGRALQAIKELQLSDSDTLNVTLSAILKANYLNTNDSLDNIYLNTREYALWYASRTKTSPSSNWTMETVGYAAQGSAAYLGNMNMVAINQLAVLVAGGFAFAGDQCNATMKKVNNGFLSLRLSVLTPVPRRPISYACMGSLVTDKGQLGPGNVCVSDPCSIFAALIGRSMVKVPVEVPEFFAFARKEIKWLVSSIDSSGITIDEDEIECFRRINKGKRSQKYIETKISQYLSILNSGDKPRKFRSNSCFVKLEDSTKIVNGVNRVRPRLIMTMSDYYSIKLSPLIQVVDLWNHCLIEQFQIKGSSPDDFIEKISNLCERKHVVTDYSAFESSVSYYFKETENYMITLLCEKLGFKTTYHEFKQLHGYGRILKSKCGDFLINSRCSGDYLTSTFNGLINYLINAYSAHKLGLNHRRLFLVVEGDDGITTPNQIDPDLINSLGFGFSSNLQGSKPGDVDFLRKRWLDIGSMVNVGRSLKNLFWINSSEQLPLKKQLAIMRAKALSYHYMSPGHPVLTSAINFILKRTAGYNYFRGIEKYLPYSCRGFNLNKLGKNRGTLLVREDLRELLACGANGFPPIEISSQLAMEKCFSTGKFYVSTLLDAYDDIKDTQLNSTWYHNKVSASSPEFNEAIKIITSTAGELEKLVQSDEQDDWVFPDERQNRVKIY